MASLAPVGKLLRDHADQFRNAVQGRLFMQEPRAHHLFPLSSAQSHVELAPSLAWLLEQSSTNQPVDEQVLARFRRLGQAHRRHGFPADMYAAFAQILSDSLHELATDLPPELIDAASATFRTVCNAMAEAANSADMEGIPPAHSATVKEVTRVSSRISTIRLAAFHAPKYLPTQALKVTASYLPGLWRPLTPAHPQDAAGTLIFHVFSHGQGAASPLLATARPTDLWTLSPATGGVVIPPCNHLTILAYSTGLAAAEALIFSLFDHPQPPQIHLIAAAEYPSELIDHEMLTSFARSARWVRYSPVVEKPDDAWWVPAPGKPKLAATSVGATVGDAAQVAAEEISEQVLIIGPRQLAEHARGTLEEAGQPADTITMNILSRDARWPEQG